jgi:hypothetical protein
LRGEGKEGGRGGEEGGKEGVYRKGKEAEEEEQGYAYV